MRKMSDDANDWWFHSYPNMVQQAIKCEMTDRELLMYLWGAMTAMEHGDNVNDAIKTMNVVIEKVMDKRMKQ